jgi:hypothetical protein
VSPRTGTAYKAKSLGKLAQRNKAPDSGDMVNAGIAQGKFTFLSGEICPACGRTMRKHLSWQHAG